MERLCFSAVEQMRPGHVKAFKLPFISQQGRIKNQQLDRKRHTLSCFIFRLHHSAITGGNKTFLGNFSNHRSLIFGA